MHNQTIPTCYFPSTVLFVDDSQDFLLNFVLQLDERLAYRVFDSPFIALNDLQKKRCELDLLSQRCLSEYTEAKNCPLTNHTINLDLTAIHAEIYNPRRFSEVSVVIVDYAMPGLDGIEFCRRIDNPNIKKILLTGQADEKLAIAAFNEGLIDRFVKKSDPMAAERIMQNIQELQQQYFQAMSDMVVRMLSVSYPSCLNDGQFAACFQQLLQDKGICEYYLTDHSGSFMLLDEDARVSYLLVKTESDMRACYDLALDYGASDQVLDQLASGEKMLCLRPSDEPPASTAAWESCVLDCQRLGEKTPYFFTWLAAPSFIEIRHTNILSYHQYLEELDAEELLMTA
ncbi:MAG: response regulator [Legionellaceae bacterium]|nr:response regulator [Legionellaceae bacterium]